MTEAEADATFDRHLPAALAVITERADEHPCRLRGGCHVLLVVDATASLHAPLCALARRAPSEAFIEIVDTDAALEILRLHALDARAVERELVGLAADDVLIIGVIDDYLALRAAELDPRAIGQA